MLGLIDEVNAPAALSFQALGDVGGIFHRNPRVLQALEDTN